MEHNTVRTSMAEDEQEIDLIELILDVCRRWRSLVALGLIGVVIGLGVGLYMANVKPKLDDFEVEGLHLKEIEQYARYQALYEEQLAWEQESILWSRDPSAAYTGSVT